MTMNDIVSLIIFGIGFIIGLSNLLRSIHKEKIVRANLRNLLDLWEVQETQFASSLFTIMTFVGIIAVLLTAFNLV